LQIIGGILNSFYFKKKKISKHEHKSKRDRKIYIRTMQKAISASVFALLASGVPALEIDFWSDPAGAIWEMYDELDFKLKSGELFTSARRLAFNTAETQAFESAADYTFVIDSECTTYTVDTPGTTWPATIEVPGMIMSSTYDVDKQQVAIVCMLGNMCEETPCEQDRTPLEFADIFMEAPSEGGDATVDAVVWLANECRILTGFCDKDSQQKKRCPLVTRAVEYAQDKEKRPKYFNWISASFQGNLFSEFKVNDLLSANLLSFVPLICLIVTFSVLVFGAPLTCCISTGCCCFDWCFKKCCRSGPKDSYSFSILPCGIGKFLQLFKPIPAIGPFIANLGPDEIMTILLWFLVFAVVVASNWAFEAVSQTVTVVSILRCSIFDAVDVIFNGVQVDGVITFLGFGENTGKAFDLALERMTTDLPLEMNATFDGPAANLTYYVQEVIAGFSIPNMPEEAAKQLKLPEYATNGSLVGIQNFFANADVLDNLNVLPTETTKWSGLVVDDTWVTSVANSTINMYVAAMGSLLLLNAGQETKKTVNGFIPQINASFSVIGPALGNLGTDMKGMLDTPLEQLKGGSTIDFVMDLISLGAAAFLAVMILLVFICSIWLSYYGLGCGFDSKCLGLECFCKCCVGPCTLLGFCKRREYNDDESGELQKKNICSSFCSNVAEHFKAPVNSCKLYPNADLRSGGFAECLMAFCCVMAAIVAILLLTVGMFVFVFDPLSEVLLFIDGILINPADEDGTLFTDEMEKLFGKDHSLMVSTVPMLASIIPRGGPQNVWTALKVGLNMTNPGEMVSDIFQPMIQPLKDKANMFDIAAAVDNSSQWNTVHGSWTVHDGNPQGPKTINLLNGMRRPGPPVNNTYNPARLMSNSYKNIATAMNDFAFLTDVSDSAALLATKKFYFDGEITNPNDVINTAQDTGEITNMFDKADEAGDVQTAMGLLNQMRFPRNASDLTAKAGGSACLRHESGCTAANSCGFKDAGSNVFTAKNLLNDIDSGTRCANNDAACVTFLWKYFCYLLDHHMYTDATKIDSASPGSTAVNGKIHQQLQAFTDTEPLLKDQFKSMLASTKRQNLVMKNDVFAIISKYVEDPIHYVTDMLEDAAPLADIMIGMIEAFAYYFFPALTSLFWQFANMGIIAMLLSFLYFKVWIHHKSMNPLQNVIEYSWKKRDDLDFNPNEKFNGGKGLNPSDYTSQEKYIEWMIDEPLADHAFKQSVNEKTGEASGKFVGVVIKRELVDGQQVNPDYDSDYEHDYPNYDSKEDGSAFQDCKVEDAEGNEIGDYVIYNLKEWNENRCCECDKATASKADSA
jgi:hypothetical protein